MATDPPEIQFLCNVYTEFAKYLSAMLEKPSLNKNDQIMLNTMFSSMGSSAKVELLGLLQSNVEEEEKAMAKALAARKALSAVRSNKGKAPMIKTEPAPLSSKRKSKNGEDGVEEVPPPKKRASSRPVAPVKAQGPSKKPTGLKSVLPPAGSDDEMDVDEEMSAVKRRVNKKQPVSKIAAKKPAAKSATPPLLIEVSEDEDAAATPPSEAEEDEDAEADAEADADYDPADDPAPESPPPRRPRHSLSATASGSLA